MRWLLFVLGGLMVVPCLASGAAPPRPRKELYPDKGPVSAFVVGTRLYTMRVYKRSASKLELDSYPRGWIVPPDLCSTSLGRKEKESELLQLILDSTTPQSWYRWRIRHGCFWGSGELATLHTGFIRIPISYLGNAAFQPNAGGCQEGVEPICSISSRDSLRGSSPRVWSSPWDFLPDTGHRLHLFFLWKGELLVWRGKLPITKLDLIDEEVPVPWEGAKKEGFSTKYPPLFRLKTDLREHFLTHADEKHFFFVTTSGKVHCWPKDGKTKRTRLIWDDARPVRLLVTDAATGRTFAFAHRQGPPTKDAPDVYFALAERPVPVACPRVEGKGEAALLAATRLLIDAKKIPLARPGK